MKGFSTAAVSLLLVMSNIAAGAGIEWVPLGEPGCGGWITSLAASPHDSNRVLIGGDMLGVGLSEDRGETWQQTFGFKSWEIADFTWHPTDSNVVWVGTMSGPYMSRDGGRNWEARRNGFVPVHGWQYSAPIQKILFDPTDNTHLLAFGGSHRLWGSPGKPLWGVVWESTNSGHSWNKIGIVGNDTNNGLNVVAAEFSAGSSSILYAAADGAGMFVSEDGGKSWTARNERLPHTMIRDLATHPVRTNEIWIALGNHRRVTADNTNVVDSGGIGRSEDGGLTWRPASRGLRTGNGSDPNMTPRYEAIAVSTVNPDRLLTCDTAWNGGTIYLSDDGGKSWKAVANRGDKGIEICMPSGIGMTTIELDPRDANTVFAAGSEYVLRTTDGGKTWKDMSSWRPPGARNWRGRGYAGWCCTNFKFDPLDPKHAILLGLDHANFWQSRDGLQTWAWGGTNMPAWGGGHDAAIVDANTMYVTVGQFSDFGGIAKTTDGGANWTILAGPERGLPKLHDRAQAVGIHAPQGDSNHIWAAIGGKIFASSDGGEKWDVLHEGPELCWIAADPRDPLHFLVSGKHGIYETTDGRDFRIFPGGPEKATRLKFDRVGRIYVTAWRSSGLWRFDAGQWMQINRDKYITDVAIDPIDPNRIAICTGDHPYHDETYATGVWVSEDFGDTWSMQNKGIGVTRGDVIAFDPHNPDRLIFGSHGGGFYLGRWPAAKR